MIIREPISFRLRPRPRGGYIFSRFWYRLSCAGGGERLRPCAVMEIIHRRDKWPKYRLKYRTFTIYHF
jgi:hypothetical protein